MSTAFTLREHKARPNDLDKCEPEEALKKIAELLFRGPERHISSEEGRP